MNEEEVKTILATSNQDDWTVDDESGTFAYKDDFNLQIIRDDYREFNESWAVKHPDPSAYQVRYQVKYREAVIDRQYLVSVDGHRAELPMPESETVLRVKKSDVNFAKIVATGLDKVDEYLTRSGIEVIDE